MRVEDKTSKFSSQKAFAELDATHEGKILQYQNDSWKIQYVIGGGYLQTESKRIDEVSKGTITLCRVSNGMEAKYAIVRQIYTQENTSTLHILALENTARAGLETLEKKSVEAVAKMNLPFETRALLESILRDRFKIIKESMR